MKNLQMNFGFLFCMKKVGSLYVVKRIRESVKMNAYYRGI